MKLIIWKYRFIIPLVLLSLIFVILWFHNGLIHGGGDEELLFVNDKRAVLFSSTTWPPILTGEAVLYWISRLSFVFPIYLLNTYLFVPNIALQEASFFTFFVTGSLGTYFLTKALLDKSKSKDFVGFVAALFYMINPYSMSQIWGRGQYAQYFSFALLPLSLLIFIYGIKRKNYLYAFLFALISVIFSTSYGFVTFIAIQWFVFLIYAILESIYSKKKSTILFICKFFLLGVLLWIIVNSWWLLPFITASGSVFSANLNGANENIGTLLGVSTYYPFPIIIRLLQNFYFAPPSGYSPYYSISRFQLLSIIPVIFLVIGIIVPLWKRRHFGFLFFFFTFLSGLIVSLGANPPFGALFVWVFEHVSVLQAFRNPYEKFGLVYSLGYSQLLALGVIFSFQFLWNFTKKFKIFIPIIFFEIFILLNIFLFPMWTGKILSNSDGKIGLSVPQYYNNFGKWLVGHNGDYRVFMTPLWGGDGAFYEWNGGLYQGVDPMMFMINSDTISNIEDIPYLTPFELNIRKYIGQMDMHPALELLRVKYFVNRTDAIKTTSTEKQHYIFLTKILYPEAATDIDTVCENQHISVQKNVKAAILCTVPANQSNWSNIRYLNFTLSTDVPSYAEIYVQDTKGIQIGWDGRGDSDYLLSGKPRTIQIQLTSPDISNELMDFSHIQSIIIYAHPVKNLQGSVTKISLARVGLNTGEKKNIDEFHLADTIGKLNIYAPKALTVPPEFGTLSSIQLVNSYKELFLQADKNRNKLNTTGFLITSQNNISLLSKSTVIGSGAIQSSRISSTKFFIQVKPEKTAYVLLSETYDPEWKLLKGVNKQKLDGSFIHNLELLLTPAVSEKQHFVVNGYANLWIVNGKDSKYAAVFMPQVVTDIGYQITIPSLVIVVGILLLWAGKNFSYFKKGR